MVAAILSGSRDALATGPDVEFSGYLEGGHMYADFYAPRVGPSYAIQNDLSDTQPDTVLVAFYNYVVQNVPAGTNPQIYLFSAVLTAVPEPSGLALGSIGAFAFIAVWRGRCRAIESAYQSA
jgi:hypothetical protein